MNQATFNCASQMQKIIGEFHKTAEIKMMNL
jgi:hypothetical protein